MQYHRGNRNGARWKNYGDSSMSAKSMPTKPRSQHEPGEKKGESVACVDKAVLAIRKVAENFTD